MEFLSQKYKYRRYAVACASNENPSFLWSLCPYLFFSFSCNSSICSLDGCHTSLVHIKYILPLSNLCMLYCSIKIAKDLFDGCFVETCGSSKAYELRSPYGQVWVLLDTCCQPVNTCHLIVSSPGHQKSWVGESPWGQPLIFALWENHRPTWPFSGGQYHLRMLYTPAMSVHHRWQKFTDLRFCFAYWFLDRKWPHAFTALSQSWNKRPDTLFSSVLSLS